MRRLLFIIRSKRDMKRLLFTILLVMVLFAAGCSTGQSLTEDQIAIRKARLIVALERFSENPVAYHRMENMLKKMSDDDGNKL